MSKINLHPRSIYAGRLFCVFFVFFVFSMDKLTWFFDIPSPMYLPVQAEALLDSTLTLDDWSNTMQIMDRTEHYQSTREHLLEIGQGLIVGRGFSALGLSEILKCAAVPKGSFYHYFQSKEGFGVALLDRYFDNYLASAAVLLSDESMPVNARLLKYFANWRQVACASNCQTMCLAVKLAAEVADLSEPMRQALNKGMQGITIQLASSIRAAQAEGQLNATIDARQLAETLYGIWVGASLLTKVQHNTSAMDLAYQQTERMLGA